MILGITTDCSRVPFCCDLNQDLTNLQIIFPKSFENTQCDATHKAGTKLVPPNNAINIIKNETT